MKAKKFKGFESVIFIKINNIKKHLKNWKEKYMRTLAY